jgi:hypothetical protein
MFQAAHDSVGAVVAELADSSSKAGRLAADGPSSLSGEAGHRELRRGRLRRGSLTTAQRACAPSPSLPSWVTGSSKRIHTAASVRPVKPRNQYRRVAVSRLAGGAGLSGRAPRCCADQKAYHVSQLNGDARIDQRPPPSAEIR